VGVLKIGGDSDLLEESFRAEYGSELRVQNLYGDFAIVLFVVREIDGGHAAAPELTLNHIGSERSLNLFQPVSHSGAPFYDQSRRESASISISPATP
jgi:hypothetical protein